MDSLLPWRWRTTSTASWSTSTGSSGSAASRCRARPRRWPSCSRPASGSSSSPTTRAGPPRPMRSGCASAGVAVGEEQIVTAGMVTATLAAERAGSGAGAFVIGAEAFHETVAAAGLELLEGEAAREARGGDRLRPPRLRLRGAADGDAGAAAGSEAVRDQPRPDPADARRGLAGNRLDPGRGRDRVRRRRRDRRQARAPPLRPRQGADRRGRAGGDGRRPDRLRHRRRPPRRPRDGPRPHRGRHPRAGRGRRPRPRPRDRGPRRAARGERARSPTRGGPSPGSSPSPSAGCSRSERFCRSCPATSTAPSTGATSRSGSSSAPTP